MSGHTELHGQKLGQLQPKVFPESVVHQRSENLNIASSQTNLSATNILLKQQDSASQNTSIKQKSPVINLNITKNVGLNRTQTPPQYKSQPAATETTSQSMRQAEMFFDSGEYARAIQAAKQVILQSKHFDAYCLVAQAWANLGDYEQAIQFCQQALQIDNLSEKPYYILAHIAEEKGDFEQAKTLFKKIIYLAPSSICAYLEISSIYAREGDRLRAKKMLNTALELLNSLAADLAVESYHKITAGELLLQLKTML